MGFLKAVGAFFAKGFSAVVSFVKMVGPWNILGGIASLVTIAVPVVKFIKKAINHRKAKGADIAPNTVTEMAIAGPKARECASPETKAHYAELVEDSARKLMGEKPKKKKDTKNIKGMLNKQKSKNPRSHMTTEQLIKSDPVWREWLGKQPVMVIG